MGVEVGVRAGTFPEGVWACVCLVGEGGTWTAVVGVHSSTFVGPRNRASEAQALDACPCLVEACPKGGEQVVCARFLGGRGKGICLWKREQGDNGRELCAHVLLVP